MNDATTALLAAYTAVFAGLKHLGPADPEVTRELAEGLRAQLSVEPRVGDFGCGVGASALILAEALPRARILALDANEPFISRLRASASDRGFERQITAVVGDMAAPPGLDGVVGDLDLIWCESAIYALGRTRAFSRWRPLLRPGGWLVFSDLVWMQGPGQRAPAAREFWNREYPDMADAAQILAEIRAADLMPVDPWVLGRDAWSNYYEPLRARLGSLAESQECSAVLAQLRADLQREIDVYDRFGDEVMPSFFQARRPTSAAA
jgi:SAM-dependent methyltransferase